MGDTAIQLMFTAAFIMLGAGSAMTFWYLFR
jgi:hypothetical protein